ncbi:expressed unknown protein [Seminavis robusta]|uniref:Uncharacterized protein n=1 Tax=Seminavis robusta TaxID=568900 RepID=A0A9N8EVP7_9STRA|nr:expressed unknown protein [Seminavis robusta]|eukprot:Sro1824_g299980.1 n/a (689) ;mRNA; f:2211-4277
MVLSVAPIGTAVPEQLSTINNDSCSNNNPPQGFFKPLPASLQEDSKYSPGCDVVCCLFEGKLSDTNPRALLASKVVRGKVVGVGTAMDAPEDDGRLYQIAVTDCELNENPQDPVFILAYEEDLCFALGTPVFLASLDNNNAHQAAVVIGCESLAPILTTSRPNNQQEKELVPSVFYSVQTLEGISKIHHGIEPGRLTYRPAAQTIATAKTLGEKVVRVREEVKSDTSPSTSRLRITLRMPRKKSNGESPKAGKDCDQTSQNKTSPVTTTNEAAKEIVQTEGAAEGGSINESVKQLLAQIPRYEERAEVVKPAANTDTDAKGDTKVENMHPPAFQWIVAGRSRSRHDFNKALKIIKEGRHGHINHCLYWHVAKSCRTHCPRASDHKPLTPVRARKLERDLWPAMSPNGPIICRTAAEVDRLFGGSNNNGVGFHGNYGSSTSQGKMLPLVLHAEPTDKTEWKDSNAALAFKLPAYFGAELMVSAIMGNSEEALTGKELCNTYDCSIDLEGESVGVKCSEGEKTKLAAQLKGPSLQKLFQCRFAIDHLLFKAVHPTLRAYLLFTTASMNKHRDGQFGIFKVPNPFSDMEGTHGQDQSENDRCYVTLLKANFDCGGRGFFDFGIVEQWMTSLLAKYNSIRIVPVKRPMQYYPKIYPHIVLCGRDHQEVFSCRREMNTLAGMDFSQHKGGPKW